MTAELAARAALAARPQGRAGGQAQLSLGLALQGQGRFAEAAATLEKALAELQDGDLAAIATIHQADALFYAGEPQMRHTGRTIPASTAQDRLAHAEKLLAQALPERALAELEGATFPRRLLPQANLLRAFSLLRLGRRNEAAELGRSLVRSGNPGLRAGAALVLAQVAARAGSTEQAVGWYQAFASSRARVPGLTRASQRELARNAEYLTAWLYYDSGHFETAIDRLDRYLESNPRGYRADEARWFKAWSLYRLGRREAARDTLVEIEEGSYRSASLYWQGRMSQSRSAAVRFYRTVLQESPRTWYGFLSASRLSATDEISRRLLFSSPEAAGVDQVPDRALRVAQQASSLFGLGLREEGLAELRLLARGDGARHDAAWVAQLAAFVQDAEIPFRLARDDLSLSPQAAHWRYPLAYPAIVPKTADAFGLDQYLLLAVMLRESAFRPTAHSGAGARGLMQLLPRTAERLTFLLGLPSDEADRLDDPQVSVSLGAHYLALLSARFGDPAFVLSAYNAGPEAASSWAPNKDGAELDEWVENIPYRETRLYVKTVLAEYASYRLLYEASAVDLSWKIMPPRDGIAF